MFFDESHERGDQGMGVKRIQEWLCLNNLNVTIDGDFGPATEEAVKQFQTRNQLEPTGVVDKECFGLLVEPMINATNPIMVSECIPLGEMIVRYAQQHLGQHPLEVGGQNKGPWVRLYMNGNEGTQWPWCAGFACFILKQACESLEVPLPIVPSSSCDSIAKSAKQQGLFLAESDATDKTRISPGSFFEYEKHLTIGLHVGIVVEAKEEFFTTIEGNTNDEGSHEGYEVCNRLRGYANKDFVLL